MTLAEGTNEAWNYSLCNKQLSQSDISWTHQNISLSRRTFEFWKAHRIIRCFNNLLKGLLGFLRLWVFFVELFCFLLNESNRLSHSNVASVVFKIFTKIQLVARWFGVALRRQLFHCVWKLILRRLEQIDGDVDFLHQLEILDEIETIQIFVRGNRFGKTNVTTRKNNSVIQSLS